MNQQVKNLFIVLLTISITGIYAHYKKRGIEKVTKAEDQLILKAIPKFEVVSLSNESVTEKTVYKGGNEILVVHFWGTWCAPCEKEFPELFALADRMSKNKGIKFVFLAAYDTVNKVKKFLKDYKVPENVLIGLDNSGKAMMQFGTIKVPETFIFDKDGKTLKKFVGPQQWEKPYFNNLLSELLNH